MLFSDFVRISVIIRMWRIFAAYLTAAYSASISLWTNLFGVFIVTVRSNILRLLGRLVEYFPAKFNDENVTTLLNTCLSTLEEELVHSNKDPMFVLLVGVMQCLDSLLTWYDDSLPAGGNFWSSISHSVALTTARRHGLIHEEVHFQADHKIL